MSFYNIKKDKLLYTNKHSVTTPRATKIYLYKIFILNSSPKIQMKEHHILE